MTSLMLRIIEVGEGVGAENGFIPVAHLLES